MILLIKRLVTSLERYQHVAVIVPTFSPIGMAHLFAFLELAWWYQAPSYAAWGVVALASVAFMLQRDRAKAEQHVAQRVGEVGVEVGRIASDLSESTTSQQRHTDALWERVHRIEQAMREQLDVDIPSIVSLSMSATAGPPTATARLEVRGPHRGRVVQMWQRMRRQGGRFTRRVRLVVWGSDGDSLES